ncbi:MAG TPA: TetR/AcrR family transcriptional regulator [Desulfobacteraceae bacterium]|nr:TetR/AcrR family transcriptional regulator [Desulfobacteraceae bacterium]
MAKQRTPPPGQIKIKKAFLELMKTKDFHSITTAVIANQAGVTEGLIYKYFRDKKDLLYQVLEDYFNAFQETIETKIQSTDSSIEKLKIIIATSLASYTGNRVFARILLLEVRSAPEYFHCSAYRMVQRYARTILDIIRQGINNNEISREVDPKVLRKVILGAIEHACLGEILFNRDIDTETVSDNVCHIIFKGAQS